jgi:predicted acyltransferase
MDKIESSPRLQSLDALRGFAMFWIIGGELLAPAFNKARPSPWADALAAQFEHADWAGFTFYDSVFPTFLFAVGASIPFALGKKLESGTKAWRLYPKIFFRAFALIALGLIYNGILQWEGPEGMRFPGVLQRIGITYLFAALAFLHLRTFPRIGLAMTMLLAYWAILKWVPVPGFGAGILTPEANLAGYLDRKLIPGYFCCYEGGDNEGLLSSFPAIVTVLMGTFGGEWLRSGRSHGRNFLGLLFAGLVLAALGLAWSPYFPVIKNLWTSSYACFSAGLSALCLALFYLVMDWMAWKSPLYIFMVVGMNAITIYMGQQIVDFSKIAEFFLGGLKTHVGVWADLMIACGSLGIKIWLLRFLYVRKIFLRL